MEPFPYSCNSSFTISGARVKVKNAKTGRGNAALVKLGQIVDRAKFNGFSASGLPILNVKLERGVYVFDCSQCLD